MLKWRRRRERLLQEFEEHIEFEALDNIAMGMSPEKARRQARKKFGNALVTAEAARDVWGWVWLEHLLQDVRYAVRQLRRDPGFSVTAVVVLALGLFASTAIYAFVDAALVKPLPYRSPGRLVALFERIPVGDRYHLSYRDYVEWKRRNQVFSSLDVYRPEPVTVRNAEGVEEAPSGLVSDGFFRTLGVQPSLGRDFLPGEEDLSAERVMLLSYGAWQRRFGGNAAAVGSSMSINGAPYRIVGVLPKEFHFAPVGRADFWLPLRGRCKEYPACYPFYGVARLKDGVSLQTAAENLSTISSEIAREFPKFNGDRTSSVQPLTQTILGNTRPTLLALLIGAALLCVIGFVNVSSLLLVRTESRRREIAMRQALGATRQRLMRQFMIEGLVLAGCSLAVGLALTWALLGTLKAQIPVHALAAMPYLEEMQWNLRVMLFPGAIALTGSVPFAALPVLHMRRINVQEGLREADRSASGMGWRRSGAGLVAVELAITMVLLVSAGLLAKSFYRLLHVEMGISAERLAMVHVLRLEDDAARAIALERRIVARIAQMPGVESVGITAEPVISGGEHFVSRFSHFGVMGRSYVGEGDEMLDQVAGVGYFETLQALLVAGRFFTAADGETRPLAVINETTARQEFGVESPLGKKIVSQYDPDHPIEVVGIVADVKDGALDSKPLAAVYRPFTQITPYDFYAVFRIKQDATVSAASVTQALKQMREAMIVDGEETLTERINSSEAAYLRRLAAWIVGTFA
ncbi:ABC transporter permease [Terriglobus sp. 2YAB30_2]|uniref:ABC transporter permease n=1 Tax=Terriglobus sp. 2YAB30_2 TaxID=3233023 RepID=UPI003F983CBB